MKITLVPISDEKFVKKVAFLISENGVFKEVRICWQLPDSMKTVMEWIIYADTWEIIAKAINALKEESQAVREAVIEHGGNEDRKQ